MVMLESYLGGAMPLIGIMDSWCDDYWISLAALEAAMNSLTSFPPFFFSLSANNDTNKNKSGKDGG